MRNAENFVITSEQFQEFLDQHKNVSCLVPESNDAMRYSYLILDEYVSINMITHIVLFQGVAFSPG